MTMMLYFALLVNLIAVAINAYALVIAPEASRLITMLIPLALSILLGSHLREEIR
jgi:hypothetical protein